MELTALREEAEALTAAWTRRRYRDRAGLAPLEGLEALFRASPDVATWESVQQVREAAGSAEGRRAVRLRALSHHLVGLVALREGTRRVEELAHVVASEVTGTEVGTHWPLGAAFQLLASEKNRESRADAERRVLAAFQEHDTVVGRAQDGDRSVFGRAGWSSLGAAWSARHDFDVLLLATSARGFLDDTDAMYRDVLAWWLRQSVGLRPFPRDAERHDLLHALTLREFEGLFPSRSDLSRLLKAFEKSGIDPKAVRVDVEPRAGKQALPFVAAIDPPGEVIGVLRREGAFVGARDFLRVWGEGRHFVSIDPQRPFEDRMLGDTSVPLAMGRLFQNVLLDRVWLKTSLDQVPADLPRVIALQELFRLRHAAIVLLTALDGETGSHHEPFHERASTVLGARWPAGSFRWECDTDWSCATELLGAALEGRMFAHLRGQFDEDWWANPRSTAWLQKVSGQGQLESARVVAESQALGELSLQPTVARLQALLA
jgi:hypothetical protein